MYSLSMCLLHLVCTSVRISYRNSIRYQPGHFRKPHPLRLISLFPEKNGHFFTAFLNLGHFEDRIGRYYRSNTSRFFFYVKIPTNTIMSAKMKTINISQRLGVMPVLTQRVLHLLCTSVRISNRNSIGFQSWHFQKKPPPPPPPACNYLIYFLRKSGYFFHLFLNLGHFEDRNGRYYWPNTSR